MTQPQIILGHEAGVHNNSDSAARLKKGKTYKDLSTILVMPTRGMIPVRVMEALMGLMAPMNQPFTRLFVSGMEVGDAYNAAVETILGHPVLSKWKYMLTVEEDNLPPPDGLLKLYESIEDYAVVGGLYWTKGSAGQPMIYGDPTGILNFVPQVPIPETVQECNGLGMGFNLWNLAMFRDEKLPKPWFRTVQDWDPQGGGRMYTQDLHFFEGARKAGYTMACDTRVKVGHMDADGVVW